ncbi:hypothetical protein X777_04180 [Ooceraea biroi]|uniref:CCHC-type domain-containing protein n=1 Tax=Ooceraea biroi TaxID=2015173 RepID=A0A026WJ45_OOCBI|nr:hypothetical protein X777_04180 [Ooceraea biroi]
MGKKRGAQDNPPAQKNVKRVAPPSPLDGSTPIQKETQGDKTKGERKADSSPPIRYIKSDSGPFRTILTFQPTEEDGKRSPPLDMEIARTLTRMGVVFNLVERIGRLKWIIFFKNCSDANNACNNLFVKESRYSIHIPWYFVYRKIVIKGVSTDVTSEECWEELSGSNKEYKFRKDDILRMRRRKEVNGEVTFVDTTSIRVNIRSASSPSYVYMWRTKLPAVAFIPNIRQCFNCGQLDHSTNFCKHSAKCLMCGEDKHENSTRCTRIPKCVNCSGKYPSLARECPEVITKRRTTELMASQNIDFNTRRLVSRDASGAPRDSGGGGGKKLREADFPMLRRGRRHPVDPSGISPSGAGPSRGHRSFASIVGGRSGQLPHADLPEETSLRQYVKDWFQPL